ncbi:transmembrane protein, partial [Cystoisospora suis]
MEWDVEKTCTSATRGTKVEYAPVEVAAAANSGSAPSLAVAHADLEPHPDPSTSRKEQIYTWRSHDSVTETDERGVTEPVSIVMLGSDALRAQKPYGWFVIGLQASSDTWSLITLSVTIKGAAFHARGWAEVSQGLGVVLRYIPFSRYCQHTFFTFRTGPSDDESLVLFFQVQQGDMPKELCVVPCAPADTLFNTCPDMPIDNDSPCPTKMVTQPSPESRVVRALLPSQLLHRNYIYGVRVKLASWQEVTLIIALWRPTAVDTIVQRVQMVNGVPFRGALFRGSTKDTKIQLVLTIDKNALPHPPPTTTSSSSSSEGKRQFYRFSLSIVASAPGISGYLLIPIKAQADVKSLAKTAEDSGSIIAGPGSTSSARGHHPFSYRTVPLRPRGEPISRFFSLTEDLLADNVLNGEEGIGDWKLVLKSRLGEYVFLDVTMSFGLTDEGGNSIEREEEQDAGERFLRGGTVIHLMEGAVYTGLLHPEIKGTSDEETKKQKEEKEKRTMNRVYLYFSVDFTARD